MPDPPHLLDWDNTLDKVPPDRDTQFCVPAVNADSSRHTAHEDTT